MVWTMEAFEGLQSAYPALLGVWREGEGPQAYCVVLAEVWHLPLRC